MTSEENFEYAERLEREARRESRNAIVRAFVVPFLITLAVVCAAIFTYAALRH